MVVTTYDRYSGCGNTFFLVDNRDAHFEENVPELCHQMADGVILLENSQKSDYKMRIFNADGSEAEMCGNGVRCLMQFIRDLHPEKTRCSIETLAGEVVTYATEPGVKVDMPKPWNFQTHQFGERLCYSIDTGVPHAVFFVENLERVDLMKEATPIRNHLAFGPRGTNVNFAQLKGSEIWVRTYERGVEGETQACGTGATAVALIASKIYGLPAPITIIPSSKDPLQVEFDSLFLNVALIGPAQRI